MDIGWLRHIPTCKGERMTKNIKLQNHCFNHYKIPTLPLHSQHGSSQSAGFFRVSTVLHSHHGSTQSSRFFTVSTVLQSAWFFWQVSWWRWNFVMVKWWSLQFFLSPTILSPLWSYINWLAFTYIYIYIYIFHVLLPSETKAALHIQ